MRLEGVDHVAFAVADQERSIAWYREVLGLVEEHPAHSMYFADPDGVRLEPTTYELG